MRNVNGQICWECGGDVVPTAAPGRTGSYRGRSGFGIPADLAIPTCQSCGAEWIDNDLIDVLDAVFERQYRSRMAGPTFETRLQALWSTVTMATDLLLGGGGESSAVVFAGALGGVALGAILGLSTPTIIHLSEIAAKEPNSENCAIDPRARSARGSISLDQAA